ncbi:ATP-binding cassette domain-containing protein [Flavobacterium agricola]|uniref:ATP-binding cassette domain-containing protein n=1 Tax=Flavobacterium agricola TaxID=2870839 RepID=UPI0022220A58|nr:ATP-binding cassette domain-containing protein [Flavobacterium agricola]
MIRTNQLSYCLKQAHLLKNINIELMPNEFVAIIGPNGAGKSTLLNALANEIKTIQTQVVIKDQPLHAWDLKTLSNHKAKFTQHQTHNINLTVKQVILIGRYAYFEANPQKNDLEVIDKWMQKFQIKHLQNRLYNQLSGGEKQRVHLARVMVQLENSIENKIVFLDEPLNNLDVLHQFTLLQILKEYKKQGHLVVAVLYDINLAGQFADKIILMKNGEVKGFDTPTKVLTEKIISETFNFPCRVHKNPHPTTFNFIRKLKITTYEYNCCFIKTKMGRT